MKPTEKAGWEVRFGQMYEAELLNKYGSIFKESMKNFIKQEIASAEKKERDRIHNAYIESRINIINIVNLNNTALCIKGEDVKDEMAVIDHKKFINSLKSQ